MAPPQPQPPRVVIPRPPRSPVGLGDVARAGHVGALAVLVWQLLLLSQWRLPFEKSAEVAPRWTAPFELARLQVGSPHFTEVRDVVLGWGPAPAYPWLFPACAVALVLLLRAVRFPDGVQWFLGTCASAYGLVALYANGPDLLRHWPLTGVLLVLGFWLLQATRIP
ncbi:hypothetical protein [Streptomyces bambusae]|uniref:Glycosyltransferase RgtA/B/C/D-like domain-containing protein n=1 Tax=Streptomyces bambusae TaxID=1550616 RepID=A0ABS6ZAR7_9ACTN|nr:hypothetical protein [Streptomyces bambusae]MBW5484867.1 hypothetical protein [Streptomyces bambusae]